VDFFGGNFEVVPLFSSGAVWASWRESDHRSSPSSGSETLTDFLHTGMLGTQDEAAKPSP